MLVNGASVAKLSAEHDIKPRMLNCWLYEASRELYLVLARYEAVLRENQKLKREVRDLKVQRAVFKLAFGGAGLQNATK